MRTLPFCLVVAVAALLFSSDGHAQRDSAVDRAQACPMGEAYNQCVLDALEGERSARAMMMRIEAYRSLNDDAARERAIRAFVRAFPGHSRARRYARELSSPVRRAQMNSAITRVERRPAERAGRRATRRTSMRTSAVDRARQCPAGSRDYHQCVLRELRGVGSASAFMMRIEAHRGLGDVQKKRQEIRRFITAYPDHSRASRYAREL